MHADIRVAVHLHVDACSTGEGAIAGCQAYHTEFITDITNAEHPISHLEKEMNAITAIQTWMPQFHSKLVHLYCTNATAVGIFQVGHNKDSWIQAGSKCVLGNYSSLAPHMTSLWVLVIYLESTSPHQQQMPLATGTQASIIKMVSII